MPRSVRSSGIKLGTYLCEGATRRLQSTLNLRCSVLSRYERRLELRWRKIDPSPQHPMEEPRIEIGIGFLCRGVIRYRLLSKENTPHATYRCCA